MLWFNGILLCLFIVCYLQAVQSSKSSVRLLSIQREELNRPLDIEDENEILIRTQNFYMPFSVRHHNKRDINITSTERSDVTESSKESQVNSRHELLETSQDNLASTSVTSSEQQFIPTITQPKHIYKDAVVIRFERMQTTKNLRKSTTNVRESVNASLMASKSTLYDIVGITYLCDSDVACISLLENSLCQLQPEGEVGMGYCKCTEDYVYDGKKCLKKSSAYFCSSHEECAAVAKNSRCFNIMTPVRVKLCMCSKNYNYIIDEHSCLPKVSFGEYCISSKQCPSNGVCLSSHCRLGCSIGYTWKDDHCVKDLPYIPPGYYNKDDSLSTNTRVFYCIIGGIFVAVTLIVISLTLALRRHTFQAIFRNPPQRQENIRPLEVTVPDQPPSYDDIITTQTASLMENVQQMAEDAPPSYKSWEEARSNTSVVAQS